MAKCIKPSKKVSNAGKTLSGTKNKTEKSKAAKILKKHQDTNH